MSAAKTAADAPAWLRPTAGEQRWPAAGAVVVAIVLQLLLPERLGLRPHALLPILEAVLLAGLVVVNPVRLAREHPAIRAGSIALTAVVTVANAVSAALLIRALLSGGAADRPQPLLANGAAIYLTNVLAFGLWFWELDRGGPFARAAARRRHGDFLFPQMASPDLAPPDWEPRFVDYLYVSFTNATAFSPTDTMPLSRWAKVLMLVQSAVALAVVALVVARAVNVLR